MPIKIPKAFGRRKPTDKALEEVENPPEPSFRVFERPAGGSKSFDAGSRLKALSGARPESVPNIKNSNNHVEVERIFSGRGSGGSKNSASTGGYYDTSSSSARLSSSSTLPSSNDAHTPEDPYFPRSTKPLPNVPIPPIPQSKPGFTLGGKTFSFGGTKTPSPPASSGATERRYQPYSGPPYNGDFGSKKLRDRAMTESSYASTATPPKLDTQLPLGSSDMDGFGNMFESFGKRKSTLMEDGEPKLIDSPTAINPGAISPSGPAVPPKTYSNQRLSYAAPAPVSISATRSREIDPSPYSWGSHNSNEGLVSSLGRDSGPPTPSHVNIRALTPSSTMPVKPSSSGLLGGPRPQRPTDGGLKRSSGYGLRRPSLPFEDEDAKLVAANRSSRQNGAGIRSQTDRFRENNWEDQRTSPSPERYSDTKSSNQSSRSGSGKDSSGIGLFDSQDTRMSRISAGCAGSLITSKPAGSAPGQDDLLFDTSFTSSAKLAAQFEEHLNSPQRQAEEKKVMTPAQFERYRQQQEHRSKMDASKSDDSDDDDAYDDEDETERNRLAAKQRQKQEAHLTLYRQQMMKVTGEQPSQIPNFTQRNSVANFGSSSSLPNLASGLSTINLNGDSKDEGKGFDDSDEDVPLGILAAHGFPNKNRPPGTLVSAASNPNLRASSQMSFYPPPPPRSVTGDAAAPAGSSGKLPPFARNLPRDPYFGAGLVNPSNRESLAFSHNGRASVYGGGPPAPGISLVNVIENEERSRAMRRGSPNSAAITGRSGSPGGGLLGMGAGAGMGGPQIPGMGGMPMGMGPMGMGGMPMMAPGDQMQMQMTQQMTQMMQMQMEWMEKMMQMQQMHTGQQPAPSVGRQESSFLGVPGQKLGKQSLDPQMHQRTMSMLDPSSSKWTRPANYRASTFAPSVNSRTPGDQSYAPSIAPSERSTVGLPSRYRPVSHVPAAATSNRASTLTSGVSSAWQDKQAPPQSKMQQVKGADGNSDDDDDEGWEEMKKRRDKKRSNWKNKSDKHALKELFFGD